MSKKNNSYTIASLSENGNEHIRYRIPIYQRLFVWDEKHINQLLKDLYEACNSKTSNCKPYYIGIITIVEHKEEKVWEIVDGQQRLTFLTLFAALVGRKKQEFNSFLFKKDESLRMEYVGREHDSEDIKYIADTDFSQIDFSFIKNKRFERFISIFNSFIEKNNCEDDFFEFVRGQVTLLCSKLDSNYTPHELNKHFERMNATGRQLEPQDIVKGEYFSKYAVEFNKLIDFSEKYSKGCENNEKKDYKNIVQILAKMYNKYDESKTETIPKNSTRAIFSESTFLLHVLRLTYGEKIPLDQYKLLKIFKENYVRKQQGEYIEKMKAYRKWLDDNVIYISDDGYSFRNYDNKKNTVSDDDRNKKKPLLQYQAMLTVSSSDYQEWVLKAYEESRGENLSLEHLKKIDNRTLPEPIGLCYGRIDRYWFWKLDYLLWETCFDKKWSDEVKINVAGDDFKFTEEEFKAIKNYSFKENRSIEHLHPQSSHVSFNEQLHSFGNLAMISSSFNSAQGNDGVLIKFARLTTRIKEGQHLESIKLLLMFKLVGGKESEWTPEMAKKHGEKMYKILEKEYRKECVYIILNILKSKLGC